MAPAFPAFHASANAMEEAELRPTSSASTSGSTVYPTPDKDAGEESPGDTLRDRMREDCLTCIAFLGFITICSGFVVLLDILLITLLPIKAEALLFHIQQYNTSDCNPDGLLAPIVPGRLKTGEVTYPEGVCYNGEAFRGFRPISPGFEQKRKYECEVDTFADSECEEGLVTFHQTLHEGGLGECFSAAPTAEEVAGSAKWWCDRYGGGAWV